MNLNLRNINKEVLENYLTIIKNLNESQIFSAEAAFKILYETCKELFNIIEMIDLIFKFSTHENFLNFLSNLFRIIIKKLIKENITINNIKNFLIVYNFSKGNDLELNKSFPFYSDDDYECENQNLFVLEDNEKKDINIISKNLIEEFLFKTNLISVTTEEDKYNILSKPSISRYVTESPYTAFLMVFIILSFLNRQNSISGFIFFLNF